MFNLSQWNGQHTALCGFRSDQHSHLHTGTNTVTVFILGGAYNPTGHTEIQFKNREQTWSEPAFYVHIDISPADTLFASFSFILYIRWLPTPL